MNYSDFEKHMKKELGSAKEPVQMDALLASLDLGKKPKKKRFALWMIIPFLLLTVSVFAWKYMDAFYAEDVEMSLSQSSAEREQSNRMVSSIPTLTTKQKGVDTDESTELQAGKTQIPNESPTEVIAPNNSKTSTFSFNEDSSNRENKTSTTTTTNTNSNITTLSDQSPSQPKSDLEMDVIDLKLDVPLMVPNSVEDEAISEETKRPSMRPLIAENTADVISRSTLDIRELENSASLFEDAEVDGNLFSRMKINCPSFDNVGWNIALMPEVGVFMPYKTLENTLMEQSGAFIERQASERTLEGLQLGLYGMLVRDNSPFFIKAGVSYSRISERMDLQYEYVEQDTTIGIISSTVSSNGDTITHIYGDIITETTFKGSNRQHHYIHLFDIPISVGYTTYIGGLDVGFEGGVRVNFMARATGNLLTSASEYTNLSLNRLFKNRVGLSYFGGLMIGRNFGRFGDFYVAPRFTYFPDQFNNENNPVSQRYFTVGLNAGVVYKIK